MALLGFNCLDVPNEREFDDVLCNLQILKLRPYGVIKMCTFIYSYYYLTKGPGPLAPGPGANPRMGPYGDLCNLLVGSIPQT